MLRIGHRGIPALEPENTLRSFRRALQLGAKMIECDVHVTRDGHVVVIHDDTVDRTTNGYGRVNDLTLRELRMLDAGQGEKIPLLESVLMVVRSQILNIEVKNSATLPFVEGVLKMYPHKKVIISSSSLNALRTRKPKALVFHAFEGDVLQSLFDWLAFLLMPLTKLLLLHRLRSSRADAVSLTKMLATRGMVRFLHGQGYKVYVWTVNSKEEIDVYRQRGVDGIFSNDVRLFDD